MKIKIVPRSSIVGRLPEGCSALPLNAKQAAVACFSEGDLRSFGRGGEGSAGGRQERSRASRNVSALGGRQDFVLYVKGIRGASVPIYVHVRRDVWLETSMTESTLKKLFSKVFSDTMRRWKWAPNNLHVLIAARPSSRWLARSRLPRREGVLAGINSIEINPKLLKSYSPHAHWRCLVHEFAHLKRNLEPGVIMKGRAWRGGHDDRFCDLLGMVDPIVANSPKDCRYYRDDVT